MPGTCVTVFGYWACPLLFTYRYSLQIKTDNERSYHLIKSKTTLTPNFRTPSRLSCNVKASDGRVTLLQTLLVPSLIPPKASFCLVACQVGPVPVAFATTRDPCLFALPNEMTKQQICICRNRCCNRFHSF